MAQFVMTVTDMGGQPRLRTTLARGLIRSACGLSELTNEAVRGDMLAMVEQLETARIAERGLALKGGNVPPEQSEPSLCLR